MHWEPRWPFNTRDIAIAHEDAYCDGFYKPERGRAIQLVSKQDLQLEDWLERVGADRLRQDPANADAIRSIYLWKVRANAEANCGSVEVPEELLSRDFADALSGALISGSDAAMGDAVGRLQQFPGVRVRVASAFTYWLRPEEYQIIDVRSTQALDLAFTDADYTPENYLRFCHLSRELAREHSLTLRQADRALFAYHALASAGHFIA